MRFKEGETVAYAKTGTTGRVVKIHELDGKTWVELDSTGLLYEENTLDAAPQVQADKPVKVSKPDRKARIQAEEDTAPMDNIKIDTGGTCSGGG